MSTGVLISGGLDSAVLLAEEAGLGEVQPIYVTVGVAWEDDERYMLAEFLSAARLEHVRPLVSLSVDMRDVYPPAHWAMTGRAPGYHTPDEEVYLAGRNIVLLGKAGVFAAGTDIHRLVVGTLDHNPFPDATPAFRSAMASALTIGLAHAIDIAAPYAAVRKSEVIRRGAALRLPLDLTLSCMSPKGGCRVDFSGSTSQNVEEIRGAVAKSVPGQKGTRPLHCGVCSKCRERHDAFLEAGISDPTVYADRAYTS